MLGQDGGVVGYACAVLLLDVFSTEEGEDAGAWEKGGHVLEQLCCRR